MQANEKRDRKKKAEPYSYLDFSFYNLKEADDAPAGYYGASYLFLQRKGLLPAWALFCFQALSSTADSSYVPGEAAFISEDAILLHPIKKKHGYEGLMIALESASNQRRLFRSTAGEELYLSVPLVETKAVAREGEFFSL